MACLREYNGIKIAIRESDGFIDATAMCRAGNKKFADWYRLGSTKKLTNALKEEIQQDVIEVTVGGHSGSWIHPRLATCLAQWIDPLFALKVSGWIEEWRALNNNNQRYIRALQELQPSENNQAEKEVQERLQKELGGWVEEKTPAGYIDLLTDDQIIEIKEISNWKQAMGQLLSYSKFHPSKQKRLHLFNSASYEDKEVIEYVCADYGIAVTYE